MLMENHIATSKLNKSYQVSFTSSIVQLKKEYETRSFLYIWPIKFFSLFKLIRTKSKRIIKKNENLIK